MSDEPPDLEPTQIVRLAVMVEGGLIVLAFLAGWVCHTPPLDTLHWSAWELGIGVLVALPMLVLFAICVRWPVGPLRRIKQFTDQIIVPLFRDVAVFDLFGIALLAGLGEEMLFRGVLQAAFTRWMDSPLLGLVLASLLFGILHAVTTTYLVFATLMGAYLGWVWSTTESLLVVSVAHGLYDFLALVYLVRGAQSSEPEQPPPLDEPPG
jgi:membrane protease YdiL (CAAX protease family)